MFSSHLQLQALIQHHPTLHPGLLQVRPLTVQSLQFLLDLRTGIVTTCEQLLPKLLKGLEGSSTGINLSPVLLQRKEKPFM